MREYLPEAFQVYHEKVQRVIIGYDERNADTIKWKKFPIRFCIDKKSFLPVSNGYEIIKNAITVASRDWGNLCKVKFDYLPAFDERPATGENIDFVIEYQPSGSSRFVASAFYPDSPKSNRLLRIYSGYWNGLHDKAGVLRHELGHILGFKHEHSSKMNLVPLQCRLKYGEEYFPALPITVYDSFSVMHYFCGGAGTHSMLFSKRDTAGFRLVYGY
ncbi:zinc metalloprotease [Chitinophaga filiformis]|nr:hypothetical protein [Chitinophaga filiformis]